jgi:uncharacterized iron-regulated membrane protein
MAMLRKWLILTHRYLGLVLSLLFVVWFASGITMMYAGGMPRLTPQLRLARLPDLNLAAVRQSPLKVAERANLAGSPGRVTLLTIMDRPAYRFSGGSGTTIFADTGDLLADVDAAAARTIAARFMNLPEEQVHDAGKLTRPDQWTLTEGRQMPAYKFRVDDVARSEVYVSAHTAEVAVLTTRRTRALAWVGTIPHWLYFAPLRLNGTLWTRVVVWTSVLGCVLAAIGLVLGVVQFRRSRPFRMSGAIPYSGWMRWHYITGVIFGVFTLTWVFSGLMSMEPWDWTRREGLRVSRDALSGGPLNLSAFAPLDPPTWQTIAAGRAIKEIEYVRIQDEPYYVIRHAADQAAALPRAERLHQPYGVTGRVESDRLMVNARTLEIRHEPFSVESLVSRLRTAVPDAPILETTLLPDYDSYYYSRGRQTPLPVLRVKFADPDRTWVYIDPEMSQLLASVHRFSRVERWLFNGLHSLDFPFWYNKRPVWDIGMILLCLGGIASSGIGLWVGINRARRSLRRAARMWSPRPRDLDKPAKGRRGARSSEGVVTVTSSRTGS